jgi:acyl-CoA synthetase (AMP-forming)/AMP-acid ligase II
MAGGDVYITGRIKDIIIRAGRHLYPQEIEEGVAEILGVTDRRSGTERVLVLAETGETDPAVRAKLRARA